MAAPGAVTHPGRLARAAPQRPGQARCHAPTARRGPDGLPAHEAGLLRCHELPGARACVRACGPPKSGLFLCLFAHGLRGYDLRAARRRRFPARGCPDLCGKRARGDVCRRPPLPLRLLGAHGDFIRAFGIAPARTICRGSRVPLPPGPHLRGAHPACGDRAALVPDRVTCLRGHGRSFRRLGLGHDPHRFSSQRGCPATGGMASGRLPRGHGHGRGLHDRVHHQVRSLRFDSRLRRDGTPGVVGRRHGRLRRGLRCAGKRRAPAIGLPHYQPGWLHGLRCGNRDRAGHERRHGPRLRAHPL